LLKRAESEFSSFFFISILILIDFYFTIKRLPDRKFRYTSQILNFIVFIFAFGSFLLEISKGVLAVIYFNKTGHNNISMPILM
jgi:hypothetical protein